MPLNTLILKARAKKLKYLAKQKELLANDDSDGDISDIEMDDETLSKYLGHFINDDHIIIDYLDRGTFSKVWLVYNWVKKNLYVAKVYNSENQEEYRNELMMLKQYTSYDIESTTNITFIDNFETNLNKENSYVIILPYLGKSLNDYICDKEENNQNLSYEDIRIIMKKIVYSVSKLHELNILHTDLKMDNLLTNVYERYPNLSQFLSDLDLSTVYYKYLNCNTPDDLLEKNKNRRKLIKRKIKNRTHNQVTEYLNNKLENYFESLNSNNSENSENNDNLNTEDNMSIDESLSILEDNFSIMLTDLSNATIEKDIIDNEPYQIRAYRSAENILGIKYNIRSESWAIGCILWEILTGDKIFEPNLNQPSIDRDREQLSIMETYLGKINKEITMDCPRSWELYEDSGKIIKHKKVKRMELNEYLSSIRDDLSDEQISQICTFLKKTWYYNHLKRLSAEELLKDEFLNIN
jgi:serine/threonine-protein kinase SRPK3